jgi:hypothetical protein
VLQEIRRDLGQSTLGFQKGELLALFLGSGPSSNARAEASVETNPDRTSH